MKSFFLSLFRIIFAVSPLRILILSVIVYVTNRRTGIPDILARALHREKQGKSPWVRSHTKVSDSRIAVVSVAGLAVKGRPAYNESVFTGDFSYRTISSDLPVERLSLPRKMIDRRFMSVDPNMALPLKALEYLKQAGVIKGVAENHYSFYPYTTKINRLVDGTAKEVARKLRYEGADKVVVIPAAVLAEESALLIQRAIENEGIPTVSLSYTRETVDRLKPPRTCLYAKGSICKQQNYLNDRVQIHLMEFLLSQFDLVAKPGEIRKLSAGMPDARMKQQDAGVPKKTGEIQKDLFK